MSRRTINMLAFVLVLAGCSMLIWWASGVFSSRVRGIIHPTTVAAELTASPLPEPTATLDERLVPTLPAISPTPLPWTPRPTATGLPTQTASPTATPSPTRTATPSQVGSVTPAANPCVTPPDPVLSPTLTPTPAPVLPTATPLPSPTLFPTAVPPANRWRFGVVDRLGGLSSYNLAALNAGWVMGGVGGSQVPPGMGMVNMIWVHGDSFSPNLETLDAYVAASPGAVWQVGNEPDVIWQSNCTPEQYARIYHQLYTQIKSTDPTARVAAGVVSQPTPLRLQYLDLVLAAYQNLAGVPMPVDIWSVHNAILREERGSWGVDIPPGLGADTGQLYEIDDNDRLDIFQRQVVDFRVWMRDRGYQDRPLYLTEFSILMPAEYGFPPERVAAFMTGAFDYLLSAADGGVGYPADGYRLVQRWAWYSVADTADLDHYPTGNLFDPVTKEMTAVGWAFANYLATH